MTEHQHICPKASIAVKAAFQLALNQPTWYNALMKFFRNLLLATAALVGSASAQFGFFEAPQQQLVSTSAQASVSSYEQDKPFFIALTADISTPWHAYYRNPATVGMAPSVSLSAPEGFKVEGPYWSVPKREEGMTGVSYAYSKPVFVWRITPEASAPETASFSIQSSLQVCSDSGCMPPEDATTTVQLSKGDGSPAPEWKDETLESVEVLGDLKDIEVTLESQTPEEVVLRLNVPDVKSAPYFFSDDNSISPTAEQKLEYLGSGGHYLLHLPRNDNKDAMYPVVDETLVGKPLTSLKGILRYGIPTPAHRRVELDLTQTSAPPVTTIATPEASEADYAGLWALFGSLFLGGLILNLMPCVFPVIGLKIMSFVELGGGSRRKVFLHSLTFVLGILLSFWVLSVLLIAFSNMETLMQTPWQQWVHVLMDDAGAGSRSWAEWMQNGWVVYIILLLLLAMGLSMYGVFEIGVSATGVGQGLQNKKGYMGSFFSGLFVTVVATPCSGPFLGAAMPAAMALPGLMMVAALTFMAVGLAFPYIILGAFPSLVRLLPRPGAWMESLKQGLSFLLFAAAAWFLDIYLSFVADTQVMVVFISLVGVCAAFWVYGRWCPMYRSWASRISGFIIALGLLALSVWGSMPQSQEAPAEGTEGSDTEYVVAEGATPVWNEWSPELMARALEDGHPVYVDFTAKWCATCQANKKVAYTAEVYSLMENGDVVLMRADKTRPSPAIDAEMRRLNRSAVPVNVLYLPDEEPAITRELLTAPYLLEWLNEKLTVL